MNEQNFPINPIIPIAYNMADCSKRYVLFIGSGISKDVGVPSGWDILMDTLKKIRQQEEKTVQDFSNEEIEQYYKNTHNEQYSYSDLISSLYPSNEEQREYLKKCFEGIEPGEAHNCIAEMVRRGLIKFIITTNFDLLLETSLDNKGLKGQYSVISSDKDVKTSKPWNMESICRIYKIHGTIDQGHIRNTKKDLQKLPINLAKDFQDVIERHGVIVLGYSADDDEKAIFDAFNKRKFKGYTLFWAAFKGNLSENAKKLIHKQDGKEIPIDGAGSFLTELLDRIDLAQRGIEQTTEAVAEKRFENIFKQPNADIEIRQTIEREQKNLIKYINTSINEIANTTDFNLMWETTVKIINLSISYLLLMEKIAKYRSEYWGNAISVFDNISSLNRTKDSYGINGITNYVFFCLLELCGAILVENNRFDLLKQMLDIKRLNYNSDGMENILKWPSHAQFIEIKNEQEGKTKNQKFIVPRFHYLLGLIQVQKIPFEFDIKNKMIEADLLFFVYTVKNPHGEYSPYWFPQSPVYSTHTVPELFKKIKYDTDFGDKIAKELFNYSYEELLNLLSQAKEIIVTKFHTAYFASFGANQILKDF